MGLSPDQQSSSILTAKWVRRKPTVLARRPSLAQCGCQSCSFHSFKLLGNPDVERSLADGQGGGGGQPVSTPPTRDPAIQAAEPA